MDSAAPINEGTGAQRSFPIQAATFSVLAPLVVVVMGMLSVLGTIQMREARIWLGVVNLGLLVCGLGLGIAALICRGEQPVRGVVSRAVTGIVLNGLFLGVASLHFATLARTARFVKARKQQEAGKAEEAGRDAFLSYPGWLGVFDDGDKMVVVASLDHRSPGARDMNAGLRANITPLSLSIVNRSASAPVTVDPSSLRLIFADGTEQAVLPSQEVLATAREDPGAARRAFAGPYRVAPGASFPGGLAFLPYAFDMTRVARVVVRINDRDEVIEGRCYTQEEKAELHRRGTAAARGEAPSMPMPPKPPEQQP